MKKKAVFKKIKKHLKDFMLDEEGFASKDKMLKLGTGTVVALGVFSELYHSVSFADTHSSHTSHSSSSETVHSSANIKRTYHQKTHTSNHSSHSSHSSVHSNHSNHSSY